MVGKALQMADGGQGAADGQAGEHISADGPQ
jgi:hypothetical protein